MPASVIVYTGDGKGKTSAGLGLVCRALGNGDRVAFVQFIKSWHVSEDRFFESIQPLFSDKLTLYKGGKGFYQLAISAPRTLPMTNIALPHRQRSQPHLRTHRQAIMRSLYVTKLIMPCMTDC